MKFSAFVILTALTNFATSTEAALGTPAERQLTVDCIAPHEEPEPEVVRTSGRVSLGGTKRTPAKAPQRGGLVRSSGGIDRKLEVCEKKGGQAGGDPHFVRWQQTKRDSFHGVCDLVLFHKAKLSATEDLDVHIRTTGSGSFSFIESAAIKIGENTLEFSSAATYLNGEQIEDGFVFGNDYTVTKFVDETNQNRIIFLVDMKEVQVTIKTTKAFMTVSLSGQNKSLKDSVGLLGKFGTGEMVGRDGRIVDTFFEFGFEWQVMPDLDGMLFQEAREPQLPYEHCQMPEAFAETSRRLRATNSALYEPALSACTSNHPENIDSCVEDVLLTGELELAESW